MSSVREDLAREAQEKQKVVEAIAEISERKGKLRANLQRMK